MFAHPQDAQHRIRVGRFAAVCGALLAGAAALVAAPAAAASASTTSPSQASWCSANGAGVVGWTGTVPNLPICGAGPAYGGADGWVNIPGPYGATGTYYNATDGFQCVELAERFLALDDGLAPVKANGSTVAMNYHAAYPETGLVVNGSLGAVGHAPEPGDAISFGFSNDFASTGDGHVAVVVGSHVDVDGNGVIDIAQENVGTGQYLRPLDLVGWRLVDPVEPSNPEWQFSSAEWLEVHAPSVLTGSSATVAVALVDTQANVSPGLSAFLVHLRPVRHGASHASGLRPGRPLSRRGAPLAG